MKTRLLSLLLSAPVLLAAWSGWLGPIPGWHEGN